MKKKSCLDCFHCKVSAMSTPNCRLCFCAETKKKERHRVAYWLAKKLCGKFDDMTKKPAVKNLYPNFKRRPLLSAETNRN